MSFLNLKRPIVFFDTESTGINLKEDRIIEISTLKLFPDDRKEVFTQLFNPTIPIPPEATKIHGISDEDVATKPTFSQKAEVVMEIFRDSDIAGYNVFGFDYPLLCNEFKRSGVEVPFPQDLHILDPMIIFKMKEKRNLENAMRFYCNLEHKNAHSAEADTLAALKVMEAQIVKYSLSKNVEEIDSLLKKEREKKIKPLAFYFIQNDFGEAIFNFGKFKNHKASDHPDYLKWIISGEFDDNVKQYVQDILDGKIK